MNVIIDNQGIKLQKNLKTMTRVLESTKFTPVQLELLRFYAVSPSEEQMDKLKAFLANLFFDRLEELALKAAIERGITDDTLDQWLNEDNQ